MIDDPPTEIIHIKKDLLTIFYLDLLISFYLSLAKHTSCPISNDLLLLFLIINYSSLIH